MIDLDQLIEAANHLEPLPTTAARVLSVVGRDDFAILDVEKAVAFDPALTGHLLRVANSSATYGMNPVSTARQAVQRLGAGMVLSLAVGAAVQKGMQTAVPEYGLATGELWAHSMRAALAAQVIQDASPKQIPFEAFTASLLHDIGKLVMAQFLGPDELAMIRRARQEAGLSLLEAERELLQVHHGELGGLIAQKWNMPDRIVKGIAYHHAPHETNDICAYVTCAANLLAHASETTDPAPELVERATPAFAELGISIGQFEVLRQRTHDKQVQAMGKG